MKKIYAILFILSAFGNTKAQYTLTSASNPVPGDVEAYKILNPTGLFHGSPGTSQTWNYSAISISTVATTPSTYVAISSVPNNFLFPGATIGADNGFGSYGVYSNNATKNEYMGYATTTVSNCILFSNPIKYYSLPFTYGSVNPDNFAFSMTGFTVSGTFTTTGDGTGTLILPSGTHNNVLKQKYVVYETSNSGTSVDTYTIIESRYYSALSKFPLLVIDTQTQVTTSGTTTVTYNTSGQLNVNVATSITETELQRNGFTIYPNPSSNGLINLNIELGTEQLCELSVFNALGQQVKLFNLGTVPLGIQNKNIDLSELESGIYYLKLKAGSNEQSRRLTITK